MVEAAQHIDRHPGPLGVFFRRIANKKNRNVAVVACARKLVTIAWHMLKNNEPYRYAQPKTVAAKLSRLRNRATGRKRKGGYTKGDPRPATYGSGRRTKTVAPLDTIYAQEQFPPVKILKPGEQAMLEDQHLTAYTQSVHQPTRTSHSVETKTKTKTEK